MTPHGGNSHRDNNIPHRGNKRTLEGSQDGTVCKPHRGSSHRESTEPHRGSNEGFEGEPNKGPEEQSGDATTDGPHRGSMALVDETTGEEQQDTQEKNEPQRCSERPLV